MPKPDSVTIADFERWCSQAIATLPIAPGLAILFSADPDADLHRKAYFTGCWLGEQLSDLGCDRATRQRVAHLNGMKCFDAEDHWAFAQRAVEEYRATGTFTDALPTDNEESLARNHPTLARLRKEAGDADA